MHNLAFSLGQAGQNFKDVVGYILEIIGVINPILFTLAFLLFFWGLSKFILASGNAADVTKGKTYMMWGVLALFILTTFMALISLASNDLGISTTPINQNTDTQHILPENVQ